MASVVSARPPSEGIAGLVLAGGQSRRMGGGDKSLLTLAGKSLLEHAVERLQPQVARLALSVNGDPARLPALGLPVLPDAMPDHRGPLAGILAGLDWARRHEARWLVTAACDTPYFPRDLVARLTEASTGSDIVCAASGGRRHPVFALWSIKLADEVRRTLAESADLGVDRFMARHRLGEAQWLDKPYDPFFNINRPKDLEEAERIATEIDP